VHAAKNFDGIAKTVIASGLLGTPNKKDYGEK